MKERASGKKASDGASNVPPKTERGIEQNKGHYRASSCVYGAIGPVACGEPTLNTARNIANEGKKDEILLLSQHCGEEDQLTGGRTITERSL